MRFDRPKVFNLLIYLRSFRVILIEIRRHRRFAICSASTRRNRPGFSCLFNILRRESIGTSRFESRRIRPKRTNSINNIIRERVRPKNRMAREFHSKTVRIISPSKQRSPIMNTMCQHARRRSGRAFERDSPTVAIRLDRNFPA